MREAGTRRGAKPAWTLVLLAPVCAELTFSAIGMPIMWPAFPLLIPMYGAGVLLVRELVARAGGGWPSLLLMGVVYELVEDGVGLQALTSPRMYNAAEWGPRILGVNTTYWESQVGYHVVFSVLIPVVLTELLFPEWRRQPYLRTRGLTGVAVAAVAGVGLLRVMFSAVEDPGYQAPLPFLVALAGVVIALSYVALRILPARTTPGSPLRPPSRPVVAVAAGVASPAFLALLMPAGHPPQAPAIGTGAFVFVPMALAALIAIGAMVVISRWSASDAWTDQHRIWLCGGALVGHTVFPFATALLVPGDALTTTVAMISGPLVVVATVLLLQRLSTRVDGVVGQPAR